MLRISLITSCLIYLLSVTSTSHASITFSGVGGATSEPLLSGGDLIDFDSGPVGDFSSQTFGNVTITGLDGQFTIDSDFIGDFNTRGVNSLFNDFDGVPTSFRFDFSNTVSAFGFNFGASNTDWVLTAFDTSGTVVDSLTIAQTVGSNVGDYFGIANNGISFATLSSTTPALQDFVFVDDFISVQEIPDTGAIPEPSMFLVWAGLACCGTLATKRRR